MKFERQRKKKERFKTLQSEEREKEMPRIGLEPTHLAIPEPKSGVSTNFTTWA